MNETTDENFWTDGLPYWAEKLSSGSYMEDGAQLSTRDGRRIGNAVIILIYNHYGLKEEVAVCITDAGNVLRLTNNELKEIFYPPKYIMKESEYIKYIERCQ